MPEILMTLFTCGTKFIRLFLQRLPFCMLSTQELTSKDVKIDIQYNNHVIRSKALEKLVRKKSARIIIIMHPNVRNYPFTTRSLKTLVVW